MEKNVLNFIVVKTIVKCACINNPSASRGTYIHSIIWWPHTFILPLQTTIKILDYAPAKRLLTTTTLDPEDLKCMATIDDATKSLAIFHGQSSTLSAKTTSIHTENVQVSLSSNSL